MLDREDLLRSELESLSVATREVDAEKLKLAYKVEDQNALARLVASADQVIAAINATWPASDGHDEVLRKALEVEPERVKQASEAYREELSQLDADRANKEEALKRTIREREGVEKALKASEGDYREAVVHFAALPTLIAEKKAEILKAEQDIKELLKEGPPARIDAAWKHRVEKVANLDQLRSAEEFKRRWSAVTAAWARLNAKEDLRTKQEAERNARQDVDSLATQLKNRQTNSAVYIYSKYKGQQRKR